MATNRTKKTGRPTADTGQYLAKIQTFLILGCSIREACRLGEVPYRTVWRYYRTSQSFGTKVDYYRNYATLKAKMTLVAAIKEGDLRVCMYWLDRYDESLMQRKIRRSSEPVTKLTTEQFENRMKEVLALKGLIKQV